MSKKRNKSVKPKPRRKKSYAQKHPPAQKGSPPVKVEGNDAPKLLIIILLIIAIVALLLRSILGGGGHTYDYYPGMPFWLSK